jgi:hypothetical protein
MGTSVGSSPFSINAAFWLQPPYYGLRYHEQSEKPPSSSHDLSWQLQAFFFEAALTSCGILIVDCKRRIGCGYVNAQSLYQPVLFIF